jgi:hypothetical protein
MVAAASIKAAKAPIIVPAVKRSNIKYVTLTDQIVGLYLHSDIMIAPVTNIARHFRRQEYTSTKFAVSDGKKAAIGIVIIPHTSINRSDQFKNSCSMRMSDFIASFVLKKFNIISEVISTNIGAVSARAATAESLF